MANNLLTASQITRESIRLLRNSNAFLKLMNRQYDDQYARDGAKIGSTLKIRLPNDYVVRTGPTAVPQDTVEQNTSLTVATQKGVDVSFSSVDRTLSLDDFGNRILKPMMNNLAGAIAVDVMQGAESIPNFVSNVDGSGNIIAPNATTWLTAGALLDRAAAPRGDRSAILDALTQARTVSSLSGLFNPQSRVGNQTTKGEMDDQILGVNNWAMDQSVILHTTGAYSTLGTVSGANQTGTAITTSALAGPLKKGDVISFAGVIGINRVNKQSTGALQQFVVTADVAGGATSIPIYPALTPSSGGTVAFATVTGSPANGAAITVASKASEVYRNNFIFSPSAVTLATADLELPRGVHEAARESFDGISMRMVSAYNITSDQFITRFDVLYGSAWVRPEWAVRVADAV